MPLPGPLPVRVGATSLGLSAASAVAIDTTTGTQLYAKNATAKLPIASVTKLVTALIIVSRHRPDELVTIPTLPPYGYDAERMGLIAGETYPIGDLVRAALINSGNDAADALAIIDAGDIPKFAARMNLKMAEWGIADTRFSNPSGLQDKDNYASAEALGKIAAIALANPFIRSSVTISATTMTSTKGRVININTTNQLLASGRYYGIKTGYTPAAGECFVGLTRINGHEVITVILGSGNRFGDTEVLSNWITQNYQWL